MKRYSALLTLFALLGVIVVSQVATAAASPTRPTSSFAHPTLRDDAFEPEEDEFED